MGGSDLFDRLEALREGLSSGGEPSPAAPRGAERKTVLVVDDDEDNLTVACRRLSRHYEVVPCRSGEEAVRSFVGSEASISGVVMDIRMPGMSGMTAARLIRNDDPYVPIIFRTGYSEDYPEDAVLDRYDGTVDYVTKGQRGHDFYLRRAIDRGIKAYEALLELHDANERLRRYQERFQTVVEELITHERNLETAISFQASLLGQVAERPGMTLAAAHRFCGRMGGDFYDVLPLDSWRTGLLVADVSGHGIPAALVTGMLKAQVESCERLDDPAGVIVELNAHLQPMLARGHRFATVAYVVFDGQEGEASYAGAGHHPLLIVDHEGQRRLVDSTAPPVGVLPEMELENVPLSLARGDSLWLYTDGLFESPNSNGDRLGRDGLISLVRQTRAEDLTEWTRCVLGGCEEFLDGEPFTDDVTILSMIAT